MNYIDSKHIVPIDTLDVQAYYSASFIIQNKWFPWFKQPQTFLKRLKTKEGRNMYKPIIATRGLQTRYNILGQTILDIRKLADEGKLTI